MEKNESLYQEWYCEVCKASGSVEYESWEHWFTVMGRVGRDHQRVSPTCKGNANKVFKIKGKKKEYHLVNDDGIAIIVEDKAQ